MAQGGTGGAARALSIRAGAGSLSPAAILSGIGAFVVRGVALEAERRRLFPWLAVCFGAGILVFFGLADGEPALWAPLAGAALCAAPVPLLGTRPATLAAALGLTAAFLGFAAAAHRVDRMRAPVLARTTIGPLIGLVEMLDEREQGVRLIVMVESFAGLPAESRPQRVRVSLRDARGLRPGDRISATARLMPPPEAARPGGYDFARDAYFRGIGAVGSLLGQVGTGKVESGSAEPSPSGPVPVGLRVAAAIDTARNALTRRIAEANGGQAGAVAAALVTGKRGLISQETNDVLRAAGIYHVVSISGLHMVLAAGVVFWLIRAGLALVPPLALAFPIKKIAAAGAMVGVTAYCVFSGWDIAAERSLIMTLIMLGAILVDRPAISMRNLALAALIALAREPEGLLGPSFQMSFGAVAGLVACARLIDGRIFLRESAGRIERLLRLAVSAVIGTLLTTLVAQIATAPFATYHFQTIQPFGLLGNALTLPLVSLAVMPSAVLGILAYPFALDRPVWWAMGLAVRAMLEISTWIAGFSQASLVVPAFGTGALLLLAAALILATLPVSNLRLVALAPAALGLGLAAHPIRPDLYIDREGRGAALRGPDGLMIALGKPSSFVLEQWLRADGDGRRTAAAFEGAACDRLGCNAPGADGRIVALVRDKRAFAEDCLRADILVTHLTAPPGCAAALVIDRAVLARRGALAVRMTNAGPVLLGSRDRSGSHPWRPAAVAPPATPAAATASPPPPAEAGGDDADTATQEASAAAERLQ